LDGLDALTYASACAVNVAVAVAALAAGAPIIRIASTPTSHPAAFRARTCLLIMEPSSSEHRRSLGH
jgi:hypothetical protein